MGGQTKAGLWRRKLINTSLNIISSLQTVIGLDSWMNFGQKQTVTQTDRGTESPTADSKGGGVKTRMEDFCVG